MPKKEHELEHTIQSTETLIKASAISGILAAVVLISAILPMEYGIDPLDIGKTLGLIPLSAEVLTVQDSLLEQAPEFREDSVAIEVPGGKGLEYKFYIAEGNTIRYAWDSAEQELFFDFHGEPEGDTSGYFESYTVSTSNKVRGSMTASFSGSHGWYWKNESLSSVTVTLKTEGTYKIIGIK